MANSSQFRISSYLASGTNTGASTPASLGQYTTKRRDASASTYTTTSATPGTAPSAANGFLIYRGTAWGTGDSVNQPTRYDIFIGRNKSYRVVAYTGTGFTGPVNITPGIVASANGIGYATAYDESTGILTIVGFNNANLTSAPSTGIDVTGNVITSNLYMDVIVSENALAVGMDTTAVISNNRNERVERARLDCDSSATILSQSGSWISTIGNISGGGCALTFTSGYFSVAPTCIVNNENADYFASMQSSTTSGVTITSRDYNGSNATAWTAQVVCMGPR
jgi:hypothetical protein